MRMEQSKASESSASCSMKMSSEAETEPPSQAKPPPTAELATVESSQAKSPSPGTSSQTSSSEIRSSSVLSFLDESDKATNGPPLKKQCLDSTDLNSLSTSIYLDNTVVPILSHALISLDRLRPDDPVQFIIDFLQRHRVRFSKNLPKSNGQPSVKEA